MVSGMKFIVLLLLLSSAVCSAEEVTLTKSAILRGNRNMVALKAGTVVDVVGRDAKTLTVRYGKVSGTIPASSITDKDAPVVEAAKPAAPAPKKEEAPAAPVVSREATTNYGKAVEKAKENAAKHEKNLVNPTNEVLR